MRNAFASEITRIAQRDKRIVLLSGDIGNRLFNHYRELMPERFYNCGISEENMTGVAAGLAIVGMKPVTYTITPFNTSRCFEQIKIDVCYQNLPVIIVGTGSGLSYANLGPTHHSFEDIAILRTLPNITVVCPADQIEVRLALRAAIAHEGPVYIRLGKKNEPIIHRTYPDFRMGKAITIRDGNDCAILSVGNMLPMALSAAELLSLRGLESQVVSFHTVKPLDEQLLAEVFKTKRIVVTIEEHGLAGGFGSAVTEWLTDTANKFECPLIRMGIPDRFIHGAGGQTHIRKLLGFTPEAIASRILEKLEA